MPPAKTVNLDVHAIATLRYIRASMDAAGSVAVPGSAGVAMGLVGVVATALSFVPRLQPHWLYVWLACAPFAAAIGAWLLARSSAASAFAATGAPGYKLALCLLPGLFAGAVLTLVLWRAGLEAAVPGMWLLLYGCALISASACTLALVARMGACFIALGLVALVASSPVQIALLGSGFGGLHLVFGILIARGTHGRET